MRHTPLLLALAATVCLSPVHAQKYGWLATWSTADMLLPPSSGAARPLPFGREDVTVRQVVHISQGGKHLRISFTNEFGSTPLRISAAHLAFLSAGSKILTNTDRVLTFSGQPEVTIAPGQFVTSDPLTGTFPIFSDLVISAAIPAQPLPQITYHAAAHATTYILPGDHTTAEQFTDPGAITPGTPPPDITAPITAPLGDKPVVRGETHPKVSQQPGQTAGSQLKLVQSTSWYFLKDVEVERTRKSKAVVAFGDSITDGTGSTDDTNRRWPDVLAPLLAAAKKTAAFSIVNEGIGGNRILHEGTGPSALDRFDRDVLDQPGAAFVLMLEGINDIGNMHRASADAVTTQQLLNAFTALAQRAHAHGVRFIGCTILPYRGAKYFSEDGEQMRQQVNSFIRTSPVFDGFVDFDKAVQDPDHPDRMLPKYDHGDHLHPSDAGYAAMGAAINLKLFRKH